jgi:hypothetical protein
VVRAHRVVEGDAATNVARVDLAGGVGVDARRVHAQAHHHVALAAEPALEGLHLAVRAGLPLLEGGHLLLEALGRLFLPARVEPAADHEAAHGDGRGQGHEELPAPFRIGGHGAQGSCGGRIGLLFVCAWARPAATGA